MTNCFVVLTEEPPCFCINIETTDAGENDEAVPPLSTELQFTYSATYPEEAPLFEVLGTQGFSNDDRINKINDVVAEQVWTIIVRIVTIISKKF